MVARDGYQQHYSLLSIPMNDVYLDTRLDLAGDERAAKGFVFKSQ
jgi:hypothetical protein